MNKAEILDKLTNHTWVMIRPSRIEGIGVFAIRDIPKGTKGMFSRGLGKWIPIPRKEVLPGHARALVENYCLYDEDNYFIADYGFKIMDLVNFLNHSDTPNIISLQEGEDFEAVRDIASGEELLIDYGEIVETEE
jgi:SET domain-containing protein